MDLSGVRLIAFDMDGTLLGPDHEVSASFWGLYDRLAAAGWPLFMPVEDKWYRAGDRELGQRQCVVADPDGYLLRLAQEIGFRSF